jgi:uncharacterized protein YndB with AHSA1/START domain
MTTPDRIERTIVLDHPPERVWGALTTADGLNGWFGKNARVDLREGGKIQLEWDGEPPSTLVVQVVEPPRRFAYTWDITGLPKSDPRRTYVEFTLEPNESGTTLTVVETGFAQLPQELHEKAYGGNVDGWRQELGELAAYLNAS